MSEANNNATSYNSESILTNQSDRVEQDEVAENVSEPEAKNNQLLSEQISDSAASQAKNNANTANTEDLVQKMNWQRVAHKLREYNRKLLKKVFRLEQELAEINNKFNKYVEKSQSSDLLLAHQAEEIQNYQEQIALLSQQFNSSQQQIDGQETIIKQLSEQHELSQKQTAQLERECTLLQEKYNDKAFELVAKEQESQELQIQLSQHQRHALQREAELKRYQEKAQASRQAKATSRNQNYPHNRYIQPWSISTIPEPKIALPKTKAQTIPVKQTKTKTAETVKTAAEIATWSASTAQVNTEQPEIAKSSQAKKPQSLAAVDLPTFPRPK
ncbi:MAG TPA: hypothetical protein V6C71_07235 [Coleofasciculaceae cyanobacterium]|jgi:chromosome segregation ATPase